MSLTNHDLPISSYAFLAIFVVGQEVLGMQMALTLVLGLLIAAVFASLVLALLRHVLARLGKAMAPPQTGGAAQCG